MEQISKTEESVDEATLAAIDEGLRLAKNGMRWTMDEAFKYVRELRSSGDCQQQGKV